MSWLEATCIFVPSAKREPSYVHGPLIDGAVATAMLPLVENRQ